MKHPTLSARSSKFSARGLAALALIFGIATSGAAMAEHHPNPRLISVNGTGIVSVEPDQAVLNIGVEAIRPELEDAQTEVNKTVRNFLAVTKSLGTKEEDVATTGVNINPNYQWDQKTRKQNLEGYRVHRQITVTVRDLDKLGDYILGATRAGVNQVSPPQLGSSAQDELHSQAMVLAAKDAERKAKLLAKTLDAKVGGVYSVQVQDNHRPAPVMMQARAMSMDESGGNAEMGVSLGKIEIRSNVNAQFLIAD